MRRAIVAGALAAPVLAALVLGAGCRSTAEPDPETVFGTRYDEAGPDDRETLLITAPDSTEEFFVYPAPFFEVTARSGPAGPDGRFPVEFLIKGALPDACSALHDARQNQAVNLIDVTLEMRRPKGAVCAQVVRPYRFYYLLAEPLAPGNYTLKLNGSPQPFTVRAPEAGG